MYTCPVCETNNNSLLCGECGFDGSMDYLQYPTFCTLTNEPASAIGLAQQRKPKEDSLDDQINRDFALAQKGNAAAMYRIGMYFFEGLGVSRDYEEAVNWFAQAADKGNRDAMGMLGDCYYDGLGVDQDYRMALYWYDQSEK